MKNYRDDLDAAHQRIASLEAQLAAKTAKKTAKQKGAAQSAPTAPPKSPDAVSAAVQEFRSYANGTAIPKRLRWVSRLATLLFLAAHVVAALILVVPRRDGWSVFWIMSFLLPIPLSLSFGRSVRALVDPSVGHYDAGNPELGRGPGVVYYSRRTAVVACALLVIVEAIWVGWALPKLQDTSR